MTGTEAIAAARQLREPIEAQAERVEEECTMTPEVVDALADAGLFRLLVPKEFDGIEADVSTVVDVCEEISFADGSVGWAFAQNAAVMAYAAYVDREHALPLARAKAAAGMFAPLGMGQQEGDGYRVSGKYMFGSGSGHAEYMGGSIMVMEGAEMAPFIDDLPQIRAFIVPMSEVELQGNWDVMGLRGTGSFDFEVREQVVPTGSTFLVFQVEVKTGGPIYGLGAIPLGTIGSAAWAVGVARRALHEISEIARNGRARMGALPLREQQTFQRDLGLQLTAVKGARLLVKDAYQGAVDAIGNGEPKDVVAQKLRETKSASNYATLIGKQATTFAWESSGSVGIRNPSRLQRCFRDIFVGAAHMVFDDRNYNEIAKPHVGLEPSPF